MYQQATRNKKPNYFALIFVVVVAIRKEKRPVSLLFQIASTTKMKTKISGFYSPAIAKKET